MLSSLAHISLGCWGQPEGLRGELSSKLLLLSHCLLFFVWALSFSGLVALARLREKFLSGAAVCCISEVLAKSLSLSCAELSTPMLVVGHGNEGSSTVREGPFFSLYHHHRVCLSPMWSMPLRPQTPFFTGFFGWLPVSLWSPGGVLVQPPLQAVSS